MSTRERAEGAKSPPGRASDEADPQPPPAHLRGLERAYARAPITRWMGTAAVVGPGAATVTVEIRPDFDHAAGAVHGSIYFRLLDDAAFFAANSRVTEALVLTSSFHIQFLRPVKEGRLRAEGRYVQRTGRLVFADAELFDASGAVIGRGTGTFAVSSVGLETLPGYVEEGRG